MMKRRSALAWMVAAVAAVVALALPGRASAGPGPEDPPKPGALVVTVRAPDGRAVPGAHVEVRHGDRVVAAGQTNRDGKFAVGRLIPGRYGVLAGKRPVGQGREPALVKPGEKNELKITLKH